VESSSLSGFLDRVELAHYLDQAGYDQMFFADVTGLCSPWNGFYELVAELGMQIPTNDPSMLISVLATATENLGLVYGSSIAQSLPFDFARRKVRRLLADP
jgi:alkanesulfonate monooxygenase SsuD/methylene tetrahydromethanopterin reductase-like flavin-dependent oxidoreductase (luciferase family)